MKTIFVVLGMSRTGTSAIARSLKTLGVEMGEKFLPSNKINPKGFWEDVEIMYKVNRGVSSAIHHTYLNSATFDENVLKTNDVLSKFHDNAVNILNNRLQTVPNFGFKDPRTITIMPFWKSVFKTLGVDDRYIITVRNPLAAAMSNQRFIDCTLEEGLLIWVRQLFYAIEETHGKKRVLVSYESMLQNPRLQLERIQRELAIDYVPTKEEIDLYANEFLDTSLRHYACNEEEFKTHPSTAMMPLLVPLYNLLKQLANDELSFTDEAFLSAWRDITYKFRIVEPLFCYVETLHKQNKQTEKSMLKLKRSLIWKIMKPFRMIEDILRTRRDNRKLKRRLSVYEAF